MGARSRCGLDGPEQQAIAALTRAVDAVVGIEVTAAEGARSAETIGRERRGSGVVIGRNGLILTIGYLIVVADHIQVSTQDHRVLPARAIAYDLATGFGLVQTLLPLTGVQPVVLGTAADLPARSVLMAVMGGDEGGVAITQHLSTRPFSGYWEYHIESAVFTSPPIGKTCSSRSSRKCSRRAARAPAIAPGSD